MKDNETMLPKFSKTEVPDLVKEALKIIQERSFYNSLSKMSDYFIFGDESRAYEIYKRGLRLANLVKAKNQDAEKIKDLLLDLVNYCCEFWDSLQERESKEGNL